MARYCQNCGAQLSDSGNFCPNCGAQVGTYSNNTNTNQSSSNSNSGLKTAAIVGGTILGVSALNRVSHRPRPMCRPGPMGPRGPHGPMGQGPRVPR